MKILLLARLFVLCYLFLPLVCFSNGKLVLIGGGSESEGGWSDASYAWAVDNSTNKKVAVISYADETNFIPNYFLSLGATAADNIKIDSRELADLQSTYDLLMGYDVFFFKGGDQSIYYENYLNTRTGDAIVDKFNAGGVIAGTSAGMAILSGVIFTAENGSVYPDDALTNLNNSRITLADDFLSFLPGYLVDSHFTERGRIGRMLAFMANWYLNRGQSVRGIGVDDRTALCIDADLKAVVYGTGSVSFYSGGEFSSVNGKPIVDSVNAIQLLHGHSIDLNNLQVLSGPETPVAPEIDESGNYQVMLSGSGGVSANTAFIDHFVTGVGLLSDTVVVVTAADKGKAFISRLNSLGAKIVVVETTAASNDENQIDLRNAIRRSKKVLFVENNGNTLFNFLNSGPTGILINGHIRRNRIVSAFVGEDSKFAGNVWVSNHLGNSLNAYYGRLQYQPGLDLLRSTVVMANTFDANDTDYYENTTASVSYAMIRDGLRYGVYLNRNSFLKFYQESEKNYFRAYGDLSAIVLVNDGNLADFASQPVNSSGDTRNYVAFSTMQYVLLNGESTLEVGNIVVSADPAYEDEVPIVGVEKESLGSASVFPNPSRSGIFYLLGDPPTSEIVSVVDGLGRAIAPPVYPAADGLCVDLSGYPDGTYLIVLRSRNEKFSIRGIKKSATLR